MKISSVPLHQEFSESQKAALLKLLSDEDPEVFEEIRNKIIESGPNAVEWLKPHGLASDPVLRRRVHGIVRQFERHAADNEFVVFCLNTGQDLDLERGVLLLSKTAYPDINLDAYSALLDDYAVTLAERLRGAEAGHDTLKAIRTYLSLDLGFSGNEANYYEPENSYFSRVIDRRTGNPISLCTLYILLARRLKLPITGIGLPGHFVCRYQTSALEVYIDAFNKGVLMSKADCIQYLYRAGHGASDEHMAPVTTRRMLLRICANLQQIYTLTGYSEEATRLRRYMVALTK